MMSTNDMHASSNLSRCGTEEEYTQLSQLLEDISTYKRDFATVRLKGKKKEAQKKEDERRKGEEMRQAALDTAMETVASHHTCCKHALCSEMLCAIYKFMLLVCTCRKDVVSNNN